MVAYRAQPSTNQTTAQASTPPRMAGRSMEPTATTATSAAGAVTATTIKATEARKARDRARSRISRVATSS